MVIGGIFLLLAGVVMLLFPQVWFELSEWWKSDSEPEPSDAALIWTRVAGVIAIVGGVFLIVKNYI